MEENNINSNHNDDVKKTKTFYSVNLTEGRIFVIFIFVILVTAAIIFFILKSLNSSYSLGELDHAESTVDIENLPQYEETTTYQQDLMGDTVINLTEKNSQNSQENKSEETVNTSEEEGTTEAVMSDIELDNGEPLKASQFSEPEKNKVVIKTETKTQPVVEKKEPVKKKTIEAKPKTEYQKRYIVQVGAYQNKETLSKIQNFYTDLGYPTYTKTKTVNGKTYYRLRVGPFSQQEKAEEYLVALKRSKFGQNAYISVGYF
ncbi:MAG: SPOR domain-containing protein [Spirochaetes bacterium]|nr:SPOR domain-containing protein [Spirochaetota bacterium]